jgi:hypothetical protein
LQENAELKLQLADLQAEALLKNRKIERLMQQLGILTRNTSILFNTARAELDRKQREIETLRREYVFNPATIILSVTMYK